VRGAFPEYQVLALDSNAGFAAGNNAGARGTTRPYLVFLNNDTVADPGWLEALVATAERQPTAGLVASNIMFMDRPDVVDSAGDGYLRCGGAFKRGHGQSAGSALPLETFGACGAAFLIRREVFEALGGFDEDLFMVYEDVDLSYRARLLGWGCVYAPAAIVKHAGSGSLGRVSAAAVYYGQRNLEWVWLKNSPRRLLLRSLPAHLAYDVAGLAAYARAGRLGPWLRGKAAALMGLPRIWRKRREVQRTAVADPEALWERMDANWVATKRQEKRFDLGRGRARS
jgi:GT2 family glycosyltransferase